jgi:alpha-beta hydrolase superfamily lysophospholipase
VLQTHPFFFGDERRPLFGWLHQSDSAKTGNVGLLICSPLGYDAISSHRTLRHLAEAAAACGIPALRFDYDGSGDSAGQDIDPARVDAWLESIRMAAATLREQTGAAEIFLFGIRLGGTLALLAAQRISGVAGAVLVNPVVEGRRYLRELRALAATSAATPTSPPSGDQDVQEAAGFITTADTRQAINAMRLAGDSLQTAPFRVLLLDRTDLPADDVLANRLRHLGCNVTRRPFPGYADMLRDAHETVLPSTMIQDALTWISETPRVPTSRTDAKLADSCELDWSADGLSGCLREHAVRFGIDGTVFGILTEPPLRISSPHAPAVLLLNSGAVHHVGPNRLYVRIARLLALRGFNVLRFDLPGLGDSPAPAGQMENQPYPDWSLSTIKEAADYLHDLWGAKEIHSTGICSGAYHSLKAAAAGLPLRSIVIINPLTFFWKPGMSLDAPAYQDTAEVMRYRRTALSAASLRKLFTGGVDLVNLSGILRRYAVRRLRNAARGISRRFGIRLQDDLVTELRGIQSRNTRLRFVFAATDPGHPMLHELAGSEVRRLQSRGALTIDIIEHSDHTFTPSLAQQELLSLLARIIDAAPGRPS